MCLDWSNWFSRPGQRPIKGSLLPLHGERIEGLSTVFQHNALSGTAGRLPYARLWEQTGYTGFRTLFLQRVNAHTLQDKTMGDVHNRVAAYQQWPCVVQRLPRTYTTDR